MARTFFRQDTQIRSSDTYDDTVAPSLANFETNPVTLQDNLNNIISKLSELHDVQAGNWYDALTAPTNLGGGSIRGVQDNNQAVHDLEKERRMRCVWKLASITVTAAQNFEILGAGELPGNTTAAVGAVTTKGTIVAPHGGTFGTHSLAELAGSNAINPKNLCHIVDASTRDPILDATGRRIHALLHGESGVTDGVTITDTSTTRVQLSFVVISGNDLIAAPVADIAGKTIDYCYPERIAREDMTEQDYLSGIDVDVPSGSTVTRQVAYDGQGVTPVDVTTNSFLDLEGAGLTWEIRDDLEATLFKLIEGSAGGTSELQIGAAVDVYNNDAQLNDFNNGMLVNSSGTRSIEIGVTDGLLRTDTGDLEVRGTGELLLNDGNLIAEGTWAGPGVKLTDTTAEVTAYETAFGGEVSLFNAIVQAYNAGGRGTPTCANVTVTTVADTDVGGSGGGANLDAQLPDMTVGTFVDHDIYLNGQRLRTGANAAANNDVYPGTSLALGQLKFEFTVKVGDVICVVTWL